MKPTKKLTPTSRKQTEATAEVIKLGIDIHKTKYVVIRQIDNQSPQSPQQFEPAEFVVWVQRQRLLAGVSAIDKNDLSSYKMVSHY